MIIERKETVEIVGLKNASSCFKKLIIWSVFKIPFLKISKIEFLPDN